MAVPTDSESLNVTKLGVWVTRKPPAAFALPNSPMRRLWEFFILLIMMYYSVVIPFRIAFSSRAVDSSLDWTSFALDYATDVVCVADMVFNWRVFCFLSGGEVVTDKARIKENYIRHRFPYDFLATVPLECLWLVPGISNLPTWELLALLRCNKLVRVLHMASLATDLQRYIIQVRGVHIKSGTVRFVKVLLLFVLVSHWVGCIWFLVGYESLKLDSIDVSWLTSGTLLQYPDHTTAPLPTMYIRSVYYGLTSLTTVGYGDIICTNYIETIMQLLVVLLSSAMFGSLVGAAEMSIRSEDEDRANFEQRSNDTAKFLDYRKFPPDVRERIMLYFKDLWARQKGVDEQKVLSLLPSTLQQEVALYVKGAMLFTSLFSTCDPTFAKAVTIVLRPELFMPGDLVVQQGERGRSMYLINEGSVFVYDNKKTFQVTKTKGEFFGELSLLYNLPRIANVQASTVCDIFLLHAEDYESVLKLYPEYREKNRCDWVMANHKLVASNPKLARKIQFVSKHKLTRQQEEKVWGMGTELLES